MAAPAGNQFWKARTTHGRDKIFSDKDILWAAACEYFQWCEDNPLIEHKVAQFQGKVVPMEVPKMRAMTINGLCIFLGVGQQTLADYGKQDDFSGVVSNIKEMIYEQKFSGAAADLLNSNIIARDLGLADKKEFKDVTDEISDEELNAKIAAVMEKLK